MGHVNKLKGFLVKFFRSKLSNWLNIEIKELKKNEIEEYAYASKNYLNEKSFDKSI